VRARILSTEEWQKVEHLDMPPIIPFVSPENIAIVAVEDDAGKVIACMSVLQVTHFEGAWVDPEHRNAGVVRSLLRLASALPIARGESWVFGGSDSEQMRDVLQRLGGVEVPMSTFILPVGERECHRQQL
jgi:ribosomal protein S18 acetylase RimI-like enzyme